jgi:hypothetical protein
MLPILTVMFLTELRQGLQSVLNSARAILREDSLFTPQHNCGAVVCRVDSSFCLSLRANGAGEEPYQRFLHLLRSTPKNGQK